MKKGEFEGIIFTLKDKDGHTIFKWKGPQEYQPSVHKRFIEANNTIIQPSTSVSETVKSLFRSIAEVILDTSQNQAMPKKGHGKKDKGKQGEKGQVLTNEHKVTILYIFSHLIICSVLKAIIVYGIEKALEKFNTLEVYHEQGTLGR